MDTNMALQLTEDVSKSVKELKIIVLSVLYIAALCSEIRFGKVDFIRSVLNNIAAFFISAISFIFIQKYIANISARFEPRILDT